MIANSIGQVLSCSPEAIIVVVNSLKTFEEHKESLQVGRYLRISQGNNDSTIAIIRNVRGVLGQDTDGSANGNSKSSVRQSVHYSTIRNSSVRVCYCQFLPNLLFRQIKKRLIYYLPILQNSNFL